MSSAMLLRIPNEILHRIFSLLCDHCLSPTGWIEYGVDKEPHDYDLAQVVLTCRHLCNAATPFLYHNPRTKRLSRLACTVVAHSDKASYVRWLDNHQSDTSNLDDESGLEGDQEAAELEAAELEAAALRVGITLPEGWRDELVVQLNCIMDILLAHLPNVTALSFTKWDGWDVGRLLEHRHKLKSVKKITAGYIEVEDGFDLQADANLLAAAPNLEELELRMCGDISSPNLSLSQLRTLFIRDSVLDSESVRNVIRACPNLEVFAYESSNNIIDWGDHEVRRRALENILRLRKDTLRYLDVDMGIYYGDKDRADDTDFWDSHFDSFADFLVLDTLILDSSSFSTFDAEFDRENACKVVDALPESIRVLAISSGPSGLNSFFQVLASAMSEKRFPKLQKIFTTEPEEAAEIMNPSGVSCELYGPMKFRPDYPNGVIDKFMIMGNGILD